VAGGTAPKPAAFSGYISHADHGREVSMKSMLAAGLLLAMLAGCTGASPRAAPNQPTAGSSGSYTAYQGAAPTVSPNDPSYSENGAPRASQPSGVDTAGAASASGNYAPVQHPGDHRGGTGFTR
jgi:hypothetical protein